MGFITGVVECAVKDSRGCSLSVEVSPNIDSERINHPNIIPAQSEIITVMILFFIFISITVHIEIMAMHGVTATFHSAVKRVLHGDAPTKTNAI